MSSAGEEKGIALIIIILPARVMIKSRERAAVWVSSHQRCYMTLAPTHVWRNRKYEGLTPHQRISSISSHIIMSKHLQILLSLLFFCLPVQCLVSFCELQVSFHMIFHCSTNNMEEKLK